MAITNNIAVTDNIKNTGKTETKQQSAADKAQAALGSDFESFLKLLTVQLQNQDPTDPLKANEFTAQIAQLSNVEQTVAVNKNLERLIAMSVTGQTNAAVGYIGKQIETETKQSYFNGDASSFVYNLEKEAETVQVSIADATGKVVYTGAGLKAAGRNEVIWDGSNSITGQKMPAGVYTITVNAKDAGRNDIKSTSYGGGIVTSVEMVDGVPVLGVGTMEVPLDKVLSVREWLSGVA